MINVERKERESSEREHVKGREMGEKERRKREERRERGERGEPSGGTSR